MHIKLEEAAQWLDARLFRVADACAITSVSTDTRTLQRGDCYMALKGELLDGHDYVDKAIEAGASCLIVHRQFPEYAQVNQLVVADTLSALGELARHWRDKMAHIPVAVLSGSSGKTTTKEMAALIVGAHRCLLFTQGNLNNLVGLPRMVLELNASHEAAILELGMNMPGELARLTDIAMPQCVAVTNITNAHIGMFGSQEALYKGECESLQSSGPDTLLIMNADDPLSQRACLECGRGRRIVSFGIQERANIMAENISLLEPYGYRFDLVMDKGVDSGSERGGHTISVSVELRIFGRHNIYNVLQAAAIGRFFGVGAADTAVALCRFRPKSNRSEVEEVDGWHMVKDCYNASPSAVEQVLLSLADFHVPGRRFAVLGDMRELGGMEEEYHARIGRMAAGLGLAGIFTLGERGAMISRAAAAMGAPAEHLPDAETAAQRLHGLLRPGDLVLIKGSRLMRLERVCEFLKG
ncbi:MAG: UDP-N-acetylmuramoyl-tripeptide--D-alanyl-D-alanine ligase [bacterium]